MCPAVYQGNFEAGLRSGHGRLTLSYGPTYDGEWLAGLRSGQGTQTYPDGDHYTGAPAT